MTFEFPTQKILIVDDQEDYADGIAEALETNGLDVDVALSYQNALDAMKKNEFWVLLVDLCLGETSGLDLIAEVKKRSPQAECILMTAYADVDTAIGAVRKGAYDYLRKPINTEELLTILNRCFEKIQLKQEKFEAEDALKKKNKQLEEINDRLRTVVASTKGFASCSYIDGFGKSLLEEFSKNMAAQGGSIYMATPDAMKLIHSLDPEHNPKRIPLPLKKGTILNTAINSKAPLLIEDLSNRKDLKSSGWVGYKDGSVLVFPLVDDFDDILGIVCLHNRYDPPFTEQDKELGTLLASHSCETLRALKAIEELKNREQAYENLFNNLLDIFFRVDPEGNLKEISPSFESILGYSKKEALRMNIRNDFFSNPQDGETFMAAALAQKTVSLFEAALKNRDGADVWLSINARQCVDQDNRIIAVEGIARDITEIMTVRERLNRLAAAIEQAAELIYITDRNGNFQYVNPSFEQVTGYSKEEVIGKNARLLKSGKHGDSFYRNMWETIEKGDVWRGKLVNRRKDGKLIYEEASITPIRDGSGRIVSYVAVKRDITRLSKLEGQLHQAQKMEAMGTLAGGVAHDFNNILSAILGYTELAILDAPEGASLIGHLDKVIKASHRARELVAQILAFSRREEHELMPVDLKNIIKETLRLIRASLPTTIEIRIEFLTDVSRILADQTQINQVILNICTNAQHSMRERGGVLEIQVTEASGDREFALLHPDKKAEEFLLLSIRDSGHGMPADVMERIFNPYFTTKEKGEGTGLGLAIVDTIIRNHNGFIRVQSELGKGTCFFIYLPHDDRNPNVTSIEKPADKIPGGDERILVVDDEEDIVLILKSMLTRLGYRVTTFLGSKTALEEFKKEPEAFDAVITDMTMPEMTGEMLTARIKGIREEIPVLLCSGYSEMISSDGCSTIGVYGLLKKPVGMADMAVTLRKALDSVQIGQKKRASDNQDGREMVNRSRNRLKNLES